MSLNQRFILYSQHLSGTGHFVRTYEIACSLATDYQVYLVDGGRPVPRPHKSEALNLITLPRIYRSGQGIIALDSQENINNVMQQRKEILMKNVAEICPDIILVEHFPFSKWELYQEIIPVIQFAKIVNPNLKVICSLRDIPGKIRHDSSNKHHYLQVIATLNQYFQGILVHADPKIVQLSEYISWLEQMTIPIEYTGYVSQKFIDNSRNINNHKLPREKIVLVSAGGGGSTNLITHCLAAWKHPKLKEFTEQYKLIIFVPLFTKEDELNFLYKFSNNDKIYIKSFSSDFLNYLQVASLSISHAGYNTCTNILETRIPAILIPNTKMSDQLTRAIRLAERGLVSIINQDQLNADELANAIINTISSPMGEHKIDLNGAEKTKEILATLTLPYLET